MIISSNKKIFNNTAYLYLRQLIVLLVSLYTVRLILEILGVEDFGVYNVVAGVVLTLSFLSGTLSSSTQRFFSFLLGEGNQKKLAKTFSMSLILYVTVAILGLIFLETIGLWFTSNYLKIPINRYDSAILIYHISSVTFIFSILAAPFTAIIIAKEDMKIFAYVSIVEVFLKLISIVFLYKIKYDSLVVYGYLLLSVSIINFVMYLVICLKKYNECQFKKIYFEKKMFIELLGFTSWTFFGQFTTVIKGHGITILINQFFNPNVVASRAIALTIGTKINMFASNFNLGLYPSIIKSYSSNNSLRMFQLIFDGSKLTFSLMWVFALPFIIEANTILSIWLKSVPESAVLFTRLVIIESVIISLSLPLTSAARAPGKMKNYELILGSIQIFIFIFSLLLLNFGLPAYSVFIVAIIFNIIMMDVRLRIVSSLINISYNKFYKSVILPISTIIFFSSILSLTFKFAFNNSFSNSIFSIFFSFFCSCFFIYMLALNAETKNTLKLNIHTAFLNFKNKILK